MRGKPLPKRKKLALVLASCVAVISLLFVDSTFRLVTTEYAVYSSSLPESFDGFRVVQLSDLHGMRFGTGNARLIKAVERAQPDIIAVTGDLTEKREDLTVAEGLICSLVQIAPVYYVGGNHEWASGTIDEVTGLLSRYGAVNLGNGFETITRGGGRIILAGVEDPNGPADMIRPDELIDIVRTSGADDYILFLGHRNTWLYNYPELDVDLILCGHAHGGLFRLPFVGGLIDVLGGFLPEYESGLYSGARYDMIVSRGLGMSMGVPRFLNNPEVVVAVLRSEK